MDRSSASLLRVTSRPALRSPVMAARTVCGSQPSRCPISATEAPSDRSSMPISLARFVLAGGPEVALTLAVAKSERSARGLEPERRCLGLSGTMAPLATAAVASAGPLRAAAARDRVRRLRRFGWRSLLRSGLLVTLGSTVASVLLFTGLLVCLVAMASFSISASRLSRCLHHHKPGAWGQAGGDQRGGRRHPQQCSLWRRSRAECRPDNDFFLWCRLLQGPPRQLQYRTRSPTVLRLTALSSPYRDGPP